MQVGKLLDTLHASHVIDIAPRNLSDADLPAVSAWLDLWKINVDKEKLRRLPEAVEDERGNCNIPQSQV